MSWFERSKNRRVYRQTVTFSIILQNPPGTTDGMKYNITAEDASVMAKAITEVLERKRQEHAEQFDAPLFDIVNVQPDDIDRNADL